MNSATAPMSSPSYDEFQPTALVIDFHGYSSNGGTQQEESGIVQVADEYNFLAVWFVTAFGSRQQVLLEV
jgi:poly(3-hydroxybutyrate) depolymerase